MYEILAPDGTPWRSGIDTAAAAYRAASGAPDGSTIRREKDRVRVSPLGALLPDREHLEAVARALPGVEDALADRSELPCELVMATLSMLRDQGRARWAGGEWVAIRGGKAA